MVLRLIALLVLLGLPYVYTEEYAIVVLDAPPQAILKLKLFKAGEDKPAFSKTAVAPEGIARFTFDTAAPGTYMLQAGSKKTAAAQAPLARIPVIFPLKNDVFISLNQGKVQTGTLSFNVSDIEQVQGNLLFSAYRLADSRKRKEPFEQLSVPVTGKQTAVSLRPLPYGDYMITLLHDVNDNGVADAGEKAVPAAIPSAEDGLRYWETVFTVNQAAAQNRISLQYGFFRTAELTIEIKGINKLKGKLLINLFYAADGFPADNTKAYKTSISAITAETMMIRFKDIPYGIYAAGAVHDANSNLKMDTNLFGVPKEGTGASNDAKGRFGPPSFEAASFSIDREKTAITINLAY